MQLTYIGRVRFESGFGFKAVGFGFGFKKNKMDLDLCGFGFELPGFAHHCTYMKNGLALRIERPTEKIMYPQLLAQDGKTHKPISYPP